MTIQRDLYNNAELENLLSADVYTSDQNSASIDLADAAASMVVAHIGESNDTLSGSVSITLTLQESDDDSVFTKVADADINGVSNDVLIDDAEEDDTIHLFNYVGNKRYVRLVVDFTGTHSNGTPLSVSGIVAKQRLAPVTQLN